MKKMLSRCAGLQTSRLAYGGLAGIYSLFFLTHGYDPLHLCAAAIYAGLSRGDHLKSSA